MGLGVGAKLQLNWNGNRNKITPQVYVNNAPKLKVLFKPICKYKVLVVVNLKPK